MKIRNTNRLIFTAVVALMLCIVFAVSAFAAAAPEQYKLSGNKVTGLKAATNYAYRYVGMGSVNPTTLAVTVNKTAGGSATDLDGDTEMAGLFQIGEAIDGASSYTWYDTLYYAPGANVKNVIDASGITVKSLTWTAMNKLKYAATLGSWVGYYLDNSFGVLALGNGTSFPTKQGSLGLLDPASNREEFLKKHAYWYAMEPDEVIPMEKFGSFKFTVAKEAGTLAAGTTTVSADFSLVIVKDDATGVVKTIKNTTTLEQGGTYTVSLQDFKDAGIAVEGYVVGIIIKPFVFADVTAHTFTGTDLKFSTKLYADGYKLNNLVSYEATNATAGTAPATQSVIEGGSVNAAAAGTLERTGYTFLGWSTTKNATDVEYAAGAEIAPTADITLYPVWKINTYTITYKLTSDDGVYTDYVYATDYFVYNANVTAQSAPTMAGYNGGAWTDAIPTRMPANNVTISGTININKYIISYNLNGGEANCPDYQEKTHGIDLVLTSQQPTRTGCTFQGWALADDKTTVVFPAGEVNNFTTDADTTLYAVWLGESYTLTVEVIGAVEPGVKFTSDDFAYLAPIDINALYTTIPEGYDFVPSATIPETMPASDLTIKGELVLKTYSVTYDVNGGTGNVADDTKQYGIDLTVNKTPDDREGYTFLGWSADSNATAAEFANGTSYTDNAAITLYAVWQINKYSVVYMSEGGEFARFDDVEYNATVPTPDTDPVKAEYVFTGWDASIPTTMPDNALTFNAVFIPDTSPSYLTVADGKITGFKPGVKYEYTQITLNEDGALNDLPASGTELTELTDVSGLIKVRASEDDGATWSIWTPKVFFIKGANIDSILHYTEEYSTNSGGNKKIVDYASVSNTTLGQAPKYNAYKWTGISISKGLNLNHPFGSLLLGGTSCYYLNTKDKMNSVYFTYLYGNDEIIALDEFISMKIGVSKRQSNVVFNGGTLKTLFSFLVVEEDGTLVKKTISKDSFVAPAAFQTGLLKTHTFTRQDFIDAGISTTGYIVAIHITPFDATDATVAFPGGDSTDFNLQLYEGGYIVKLEAETPTFDVVQNPVSGYDITITNGLTTATYEYSNNGGASWNQVPAGQVKFTVSAPGTYTVRVSGANIIGTAEGDCIIDKLPAVKPEVKSEIATPDTFKITIENYIASNTYKYSTDDGATWNNITTTDGTFTVTEAGNYVIEVSGAALADTAESDVIAVAKATATVPALTYEVATPDTFKITVTNYSEFYNYAYLKDGDTTPVPFTGNSFTVDAEAVKYTVIASGAVYTDDATDDVILVLAPITPPTVSVLPTGTGYKVTINGFSSLYNYSYQKDGDAGWSDLTSGTFTVSEIATYTLKVSGAAYASDELVPFEAKDYPEEIRNITVNGAVLENMDAATVYEYASVTITGIGAYAPIPAGTSFTLPGAGLWSVRVQGNEMAKIYFVKGGNTGNIIHIETTGDHVGFIDRHDVGSYWDKKDSPIEFVAGKWAGMSLNYYSGWQYKLASTSCASSTDGITKFETNEYNSQDVMNNVIGRIYFTYGYNADEITEMSNFVSFEYKPGKRQGSFYQGEGKLYSEFSLHVITETGEVVEKTVYKESSLETPMLTTVTLQDFIDAGYTTDGYIAGIEIRPFAKGSEDLLLTLNKSGGNADYMVDLTSNSYTVKVDPKTPTFAYKQNATAGYDVTVTNATAKDSYKYSTDNGLTWTPFTGDTFTVQNPGTYRVQVYGDHLTRTAEADAIVTKPAATAPTATASINSADTIKITVKNAVVANTYKYRVEGTSEWTTIDTPDFSFIVSGEDIGMTFEIQVSGEYIEGEAVGTVTAAQSPAIAPIVSVTPGATGFTVTIKNYSALYNYKYTGPAGEIAVTAASFFIEGLDELTYTIHAFGDAYTAEAYANFTTKDYPAAIKNLIAEGWDISGFNLSESYQIAKVTVNGFGSYSALTPDSEGNYTLPGAGLWSIKLSGNDVQKIFYARGDEEDRIVLGNIIDNGGGQNTFESISTNGAPENKWTQGIWSAFGNIKHSSYPAYQFSNTGIDINHGNINAAIASGDPVAIEAAKLEIIAEANALSYAFLYKDEDIVPTSEFVQFGFTTGKRQGDITLGQVITKVTFTVLAPDGSTSLYTWSKAANVGDTFTVKPNDGNWDRDLPGDGWIVALELNPFTGASAENISSTNSNGNTNMIVNANPANYIVKKEAGAPELNTTLPSPFGTDGEIAGLEPAKSYEIKKVGESWDDATFIPAGNTTYRVPFEGATEMQYEIRVASSDRFIASEPSTITVRWKSQEETNKYPSAPKQTAKIALPNDFIEVKANYEIDTTTKLWVSRLALDNLKVTSPDSIITINGDGFKYVVTAAYLNTDNKTHYYNFALSFNGTSRFDTGYEQMKTLAGDKLLAEFFTESTADLPFEDAELHIYVGTDNDGSDVELRSYNDRIGKLRKLETASVENGWAIFTKFGGTYVILLAD